MSMERNPEAQQVTIKAEGGLLLGLFYEPHGKPRANLVLHGATGVQQYYYRSFAVWAARRGVGVLTYDYRDFGKSAYRSMRRSDATFADWAIRDQAAAERVLAELAPKGPLWMFGHSLGGLGFPFRNLDARFEKITVIGAGFGHFLDHPWSYRPKVLAFWFLIGPNGTVLAGYLPGRKLLLGENLPAGVYWQWRKWCTSRDFFQSDIGVSLPKPDFRAPAAKLQMLTMEDDVVVPPVAVRRFADAYPQGCVDYQMLRPTDYGLPSLGHIEVFSKRNDTVWPAFLGQ